MPSAWAGISVSGQRGTEAYQSFVSGMGKNYSMSGLDARG